MNLSGTAGLGLLAGSLKGVRVLDASRVLAGPYAGQILADLGAEVIKVEQPGAGDETRQWGPPFAKNSNGQADLSAYFLACNRGKRSITLDLKKPAGREIFLKLAAASDIVLENFRADTARDLRLTATDLHAVNPKLVIVSISGFGRTGESAARPGYDFVVQGMCGMMASTGPVEGPPSKVGVAVTDVATGLYAVVAALAGLRVVQEKGQGIAADLALIDCATATMVNVAQAYLTSGNSPKRQGNAHAQIVPYQAFEAQDGWLVLAVGNDGQFRRFARLAGVEQWADDARFASNQARVTHRDELIPLLQNIIRQRAVDSWLADLAAIEVPAGPVWGLPELFNSQVAADRGLTIMARLADGTPLKLIGSPLVPDLQPRCPPQLGQDTESVLSEIIGLNADQVASLRRDGIV